MAVPVPPLNPNQPIPSSGLGAISTSGALQSTYGLLKIGPGLEVNTRIPDLYVTGGGSSGTVTQIDTGAGLIGGPITDTGTIALDVSGVAPGDYCFANITVDQYGRVRTANNGLEATTSRLGVVKFATSAQTVEGLCGNLAVTPISLQAKVSDSVALDCPNTIASSTAVKCAYDAALSAVPQSAYTAKGTLLGGDGSGSYCALPLGLNGQVLVANSSSPSGLQWVTNGGGGGDGIPCACLLDKGYIISGAAAGIPYPVPLGDEGTVLTACSTSPGGVTWCSIAASTAIPCSCITGQGALVTGTAANAPINLDLGSDGQYLTVCTADPKGLVWTTPVEPIPATALSGAGVLITASSAGVPYTLQPGTAGQYLVADSNEAGGLRWEDNTALPKSYYDAFGRILVGCQDGGAEPYCLPIGFEGQALVVNKSCSGGVIWKDVAGGGIPCDCLVGPGYLAVGCGVSAPFALAPGTNGLVLTVCDTCPGGLSWTSPGSHGIPCALLAGKGYLVTSTAANTPVALAPASSGLVLTTCDTCPEGMFWGAAGGGGGIPCACLTQKGALITALNANAPVPITAGADGTVLTACSACPEGLVWTTIGGTSFIPTACLTGKGALVTADAANSPVALASPASDGLVLVSCSACAGGLTWYLFPADPGIPCAILTNVGDLVTATASNTPYVLAKGTDGTILAACSACTGGLTWITQTSGAPAIPCACLVGKGALVTADAANSPVALPVGTEGLYLKVCSACPTGLTWASTTGGTGIPCACILGKGYLVSGTGPSQPVAFGPGTDGLFLQACSTCPAGLTWVAAPGSGGIPCACLVGKGALVSASAANTPTPLALGTEGQVLAVCGASPTGMCWTSLALGEGIPCSTISAKGALISGQSAGVPEPLAVGSDGQVLVACSTCLLGLTWASTSDAGGIPTSIFTQKGSLLTALGANDPYELAPGTDGLYLKSCAACTGGLTWQAVSVDTGIPCNCIIGRGSIVTGTAANTPAAFPGGATGQLLSANQACPCGLEWIVCPPAVPCSMFIGKGALLVSSGTGTPGSFPPGSEGYVLSVCSSDPQGLSWVPVSATGGIPSALLTGKGDLITATSANTPTALPIGTDGQLLVVCDAAPGGLAWASVGALNNDIPCSTITGKGVLITGTAANNPQPFNPGNDGEVLTACSTAACGLAWTALPDPAIPLACLTDQGTLVTASAAETPVALPLGSDGLFLRACRTCSGGLFWDLAPGGNGIPCTCLVSQGALVTATSANTPVAFPSGTSGQYLISCPEVPEGLAWFSPEASVPCTCFLDKGTIVAGLGISQPGSLTAPGEDGMFLRSCSSEPLGLVWSSSSVAEATPSVIGGVFGLTESYLDKANTSLGHLSLNSLSGTQAGNVAVGTCAGASATTGSCNSFIGNFAGAYATTTGDNNVALGAFSGTKFTQSGQVAIGVFSLFDNVTGLYNVAVGTETLIALKETCGNTAVGYRALRRFCGSDSTAVGCCAAGEMVAGLCNVSIGGQSMLGSATSTANCSTAVGVCSFLTACGDYVSAFGWSSLKNNAAEGSSAFGANSLECNTTGVGNSAFGWRSMNSNTSGDCNSGFGVDALKFNQTGCYNSAFGYGALALATGNSNSSLGSLALGALTTGQNNTAIGESAGCCLLNGNDNVVVGKFTLKDNTAGDSNTAVGTCSLYCFTGGETVAVGFKALFTSTAGVFNTAVGFCAGASNTTGSGNTLLGYMSGSNVNTGANNTYIGVCAGVGTFGGVTCQNTAVGARALYSNQGERNTALGANALLSNVNGDFNVSVGAEALCCNVCGNDNVAMGAFALTSNTEGNFNVALGTRALSSNSTGSYNVAFGTNSLLANTGDCNIGVGVESLCSNTTGSFNLAVGVRALCGNVGGCYNIAVGTEALRAGTGDCNIAVGALALTSNTQGSDNIAVGQRTLCSNTAGNCNIAIGGDSMLKHGSGCFNVVIGQSAGCESTSGNWQVAIGQCALMQGNRDGDVVIGACALLGSTPSPAPGPTDPIEGSVVIGHCALSCATDGALRSVNIGACSTALYCCSDSNVVVGYNANNGIALPQQGSPSDSCNFNNVVIGSSASKDLWTNYESVIIGANAFCGNNRGGTYQIASDNVIIGSGAAGNSTSTRNVVAIGRNSAADNWINLTSFISDITVLGNSAMTKYYSKAPWSYSIDSTFCCIHGPAPSALPYINALDTVVYQYCDPVSNVLTGTHCHFGIEASSAVANQNDPATDLLIHEAPGGNQFLSTGSLSAMLVKSIQELSAQVAALQAQVDALTP